MATNQDPILGEKQSLEFSLPPKAHEENHAIRQARHGSSSGGPAIGTWLAAGVLAFLCGGAGSWAYLNYLQPRLKTTHDATPQPALAKTSTNDQAPILSRLDDLTGKVDQLQSRVDQLPKPITQTDLEPLKQQLSALEDLPGKVATLDKRVNALPAKIDEDGRKITMMMADIDGVRKELSSLHTDLGTTLKPDKTSAKSDKMLGQTSHEIPYELEPSQNVSLRSGIDLFQKKSYDRASAYFEGMTKAKPADARVWYFAALSRGLATRDWKGETERLVNEGVDREKAGTPKKAEIDSAFADLTTETGKEWLDFFRSRAH
jgi:TolA-binding protein